MELFRNSHGITPSIIGYAARLMEQVLEDSN